MVTNGDFMNRCIDDERDEGRAIYPGLALHVDPARLLDRGAVHDGNAIEEPHFFVCLWIDEGADETFWVRDTSPNCVTPEGLDRLRKAVP